jgi:hypothetical protein
MISNRVRGEDPSLEFDSLASEEFSALRQTAGARPPDRPAPAPNAFASPDSFFFPVEDNGGRLVPRTRK